MNLPFGQYRGREITDLNIPDSYVMWLASRGKYKSKTNRFEYDWKVPVDVWMAALGEIERRGYRIIGERFERDE